MEYQLFTQDQFEKLVDMQTTLNEKYSGAHWEKEVSSSQLAAATFAEFGELLESSPRIGDEGTNGWRWWRLDLDNDENNTKIEIVDILHFTLSSLIQRYDVNLKELKTHYKECTDSYKANLKDLVDSRLGKLTNLMIAISSFNIMNVIPEEQRPPKEDVLEVFVQLIDALCYYGDMTVGEMYDLYMKKNELNHKRVEGGYKTGEYEKYDSEGKEDNEKLFED